jgi:anthranilate synthase component II
MARILILDNYDSFTYNLVHYLKEPGKHKIDVFRNDQISLQDAGKYDGIVLSPGPGLPGESRNLMNIIDEYVSCKRIFGVCLGLQAIAESFGGKLFNLSEVYHGVSHTIEILEPRHYIFEGLPSKIEGGRYHSWMVDRDKFPSSLTITAVDEEDRIMAIAHNYYDVCAVQFHPESILTPDGKNIIFNWLNKF